MNACMHACSSFVVVAVVVPVQLLLLGMNGHLSCVVIAGNSDSTYAYVYVCSQVKDLLACTFLRNWIKKL